MVHPERSEGPLTSYVWKRHCDDNDSCWSRRDSNPRPPPCKGGVLPLNYGPSMYISGQAPHSTYYNRNEQVLSARSALRLTINKWALVDSNHGPRPYQRRALTN